MEDKKVQPKFKTEFLGSSFPDDLRLEELKYWVNKFVESGLMPVFGEGLLGNLSFRLKDNFPGFIITASGCFAKASQDNFAQVDSVDIKKRTVRAYGKKPPSSESFLHYLIYNKRKDVNAVFHGHCDRILAAAETLKIPCTLREEPYGTIELANGVIDVVGEHYFLIMKNHGFLSFGKTMQEAGEKALILSS